MSKILFLSMPSHGHVNPTLGLVSELIHQGEEVVYFCSHVFKDKIEATGAIFIPYAADLDIFKAGNKDRPRGKAFESMKGLLADADNIIDDILRQISGLKFDYMIHSIAFPFTRVIKQVLQLPSVSSLAVFAGLKDFDRPDTGHSNIPGMQEMMQLYASAAAHISDKYHVQMPDTFLKLLLNVGDINLIYTSEYFISLSDRLYFGDTYKFVGPPIYQRKENLDFPFDRLLGRKVIYISLGTVFGSYDMGLYDVFFNAFADMDAIVVMAAHNVDLSAHTIPANFIVRDYVPQSAILKHTDAAITHAGMNSISDLIYGHVPFVAIPLGADQPALAQRAEELGAAIALDAATLDAITLRGAVEKVLADPRYLDNIKTIDHSFREAGGYKKAVEEISKMKQEKGIAG